MCPKHTDDDFPSLIQCGRLVLADASLFFWFYTISLCLFPFPSFIAGATSLVLQYKFSQSLQYTCAADPLYGWTSLSSSKCAISHFWLYLPNPFTILELEK
jgi:hypothetical protein